MNSPIPYFDLPRSVRAVVERGIEDLHPQAVLVFGSRARGDASPTSDFDLAFVGVSDDDAWSRFYNFAQHDAATLYGLDLVRYEQAPNELRRHIDLEGRPLHEPHTN